MCIRDSPEPHLRSEMNVRSVTLYVVKIKTIHVSEPQLQPHQMNTRIETFIRSTSKDYLAFLFLLKRQSRLQMNVRTVTLYVVPVNTIMGFIVSLSFNCGLTLTYAL